jgi:hypothetical protein
MRYLNAYLVDRNYGGPEEGGWWYDSGEPVASVPLPQFATPNYIEFVKQWLRTILGYMEGKRPLSSVIGGPELRIREEDDIARAWPEHRPHYE